MFRGVSIDSWTNVVRKERIMNLPIIIVKFSPKIDLFLYANEIMYLMFFNGYTYRNNKIFHVFW